MRTTGHHRRLNLGPQIAAILCAASFSTALADEPGAASGRFRVPHHAVDSGGGRSSSSRFEIVSTLGVVGHPSHGSSVSVLDRRGFGGQLNEYPVAGEDRFSALPGGSLQIPIASLLGNDADADDSVLRVASVPALSANGVALRVVGGAVVYDSPAVDTRTDRFAYVVTDGIDEAFGEVVITKTATAPFNLRIALIAPGGGNLITVAGASGRTYQIQITASLVPPVVWSSFGAPLVASGSGLAERTDAAPQSPRFYRALEQ